MIEVEELPKPATTPQAISEIDLPKEKGQAHEYLLAAVVEARLQELSIIVDLCCGCSISFYPEGTGYWWHATPPCSKRPPHTRKADMTPKAVEAFLKEGPCTGLLHISLRSY